jgi:SecD/SecF fusion protein
MQNKGAIKFFAIAFALVCLYQLSFTFVASRYEKKADEYAVNEQAQRMAKELAGGNEVLEKYYLDSLAQVRKTYFLDSIANEVVYNIGIEDYTFKEVKARELNLGLDLKGGMNVVLEVSVADIIKALSGNSDDPTFRKALEIAKKEQKNSNKDFVTLFGEAFNKVDPNARLASIFLYEFKDKGITTNSTNDEVLKVIRQEADGAIDRTFQILRTRIDRFGVAQPNIQKLATSGRILIELPGIKDPDRVRKLLQGTAKLEFWETYNFNEVFPFFQELNKVIAEERGLKTAVDTTAGNATEGDAATADKASDKNADNAAAETDTTNKLLKELENADDSLLNAQQGEEKFKEENPLWYYLHPNISQNGQPVESALIGYAAIKDTGTVNRMIKEGYKKNIFPRDLKVAWTVKPDPRQPDFLQLVALKASGRDGSAALGGDVIVDARQDFDQNGRVEVTIQMNSVGAKIWKRLTGENIGRQIAIVLDNYVYSFPNVNDEIPNGRSSITGGGMTVEEAKDLANILKAGKLPASAHIVEEEVVGPSLGREAVKSGMNSFILAFIMVLAYMIAYYNRAGVVASIALIINIFFIFGVLASLGAVLTLPGIAGIVLTLGMAVDANVIIYERIKEEVRAGKGIKLALQDGYKNAYSAIIDGNVTTLLTGIILYIFGTGPVQGFATTLIIGLLSSLFTSIFISRLIFSWMLDKNKKLKFSNKFTENILADVNFDFIGARKKAYIFSGILITASIISLLTLGLNYGVDFTGGRTYVIRFDQDVNTENARKTLTKAFDNIAPEVKTFGPTSQIKVTTKYLIDEDGPQVDSIIQHKLYNALKGFYKTPISYKDFSSDVEGENKLLGILSSQKIGPTIAYDIREKAYFAVLFALIMIFVYVAIRFKYWQYGVGGVLALFHDTIITLGMFSMFYSVMPFNMEVDQAFIAAILTIIGYSINDTVIIFDRIREYNTLFPKHSLKRNMNDALNKTLARTMNTSGTTLVVLLMIFIFGGEVIRGFVFALLVGILVGTYSSVFTASPIAYDLLHGDKKEAEMQAKTKKTNKKKNK